MTRVDMVKSSGNIFRDLGFGEKKSIELILKSGLLQSIQETIRHRRLKQTEAAELLGIDQAKVSKLMAGQMAGFSLERLVYLVSRLGHDVELKVRTRPHASRRAGRVSALNEIALARSEYAQGKAVPAERLLRKMER